MPKLRSPSASWLRASVAACLLLAAPGAADPLRAEERSEPAASAGRPEPLTLTVTPARSGLGLSVPSQAGSRLELSPLETPASVEAVRGETIRKRGQHSVQEAVAQNATGFSFAGAPGNGGSALATRGFAGHGSVMQLYDGTRLYVGAGTVTFPFDPWSVDRIEVLRGPASVLYGEGAIGGVVNVVPKKPTTIQENEARLVLGSHSTRGIALGSGGPLGDRLSYRLDLSGNAAHGWLDDGAFRNRAVSGALRFEATPELAFTLSNAHGHQQPMRYFGTPLVDARVPRALRFTNYNVLDSDIWFRDNWTQFKTEWNPSDAVSIRNTAYRLTSDRHWRNVEAYAWDPAARNIRRTSYIEIFHDQEQIGNRFDATFRGTVLGLRNQLVAGFDVNRIGFVHTNNSPFGGTSTVDPYAVSPGLFINRAGTYPRFKTRTSQYALFAEDRLVLSEAWSLIGGLRYDAPTIRREDLVAGTSFDKSFSAPSWRAGAVYAPSPSLAFYGQYATAVDPIGSLITLAPAQKDFDLSTGRQIELGVKQSFWGGRGQWTLAGYTIVKDKLLTADPGKPGATVQVGAQSARGVELSMSVALGEDWRIEANAALLRAQYDNFAQRIGGQDVSHAGNVPINVPEQVANAWLAWAFAPQWEARLGLQYVGRTFGDHANLAERPAYAVVNAGLDLKLSGSAKLSLRAYNLLDEVYAVTGTATSWVLGRPRSAELAYHVRF